VTTPQEISMADVRKELNFCKKTSIPVLGVIENMADICVPIDSLQQSESNIKLLNSKGLDVTDEMIEKIRSTCPELMDCLIKAPLFTPATGAVENTPCSMASKFNVPYLGRLPMDPNMMAACEKGESFLELFPSSVAAEPFSNIVDKLIATSKK
jgi:Mrp family chromosome partitioning ATPase